MYALHFRHPKRKRGGKGKGCLPGLLRQPLLNIGAHRRETGSYKIASYVGC